MVYLFSCPTIHQECGLKKHNSFSHRSSTLKIELFTELIFLKDMVCCNIELYFFAVNLKEVYINEKILSS